MGVALEGEIPPSIVVDQRLLQDQSSSDPVEGGSRLAATAMVKPLEDTTGVA